MVAAMAPELDQGEYIFCALPSVGAERAFAAAVGTFREREGWSAILPASDARNLGFDSGQLFRMIRLGIDSALDGVGLTAAVSTALADTGIACNVVAALHHDYLFIPAPDVERAMHRLQSLSADARAPR
jgi:uncharacterized protein